MKLWDRVDIVHQSWFHPPQGRFSQIESLVLGCDTPLISKDVGLVWNHNVIHLPISKDIDKFCCKKLYKTLLFPHLYRIFVMSDKEGVKNAHIGGTEVTESPAQGIFSAS
jgi:hypothetical protein